MAIYSEKTSATLLAGAADANPGDTLTVGRIDGADVSFPHSFPLGGKTVTVHADGRVEYDDGGDPSAHPPDGQTATLGSFTFTVTDGVSHSAPQVATLDLEGLSTQSAPVNTAPPVLSGSAVTGQSLTSTSGSWTGSPAPSLAYQWRRNGVDIAGATGLSYLLQPADEGQAILCRVTATNLMGMAAADSNAVTPTAPAAGGTVFGALTRAGEGGMPVTGTSVTSGDPNGHWQVSGGYLSPSAAGAGNLSGSYTLVFDDASSLGVTIVPGRYDVRGDGELNAVIALGPAARSGNIINLRAGVYSELVLSDSNTAFCTIQSDPADRTYTWGYGQTETIVNRSGAARINGLNLNNGGPCDFWRFRNLEFYKPSLSTDADGAGQYVIQVMAVRNVEFIRCEVHCDQPASYTSDNLYTKRALTGIGLQSNGDGARDFRIEDCFIHDVYRSTNLRCKANVSISRNVIRDVFINPIEVLDPFQSGWGQVEREVQGLTIRDNVIVGHLCNSNPATGGNPGYHQAGIAFQMERKNGVYVLANIILPVYDFSTIGGIDIDEVSSPPWAASINCEIKGNTCVGEQSNNPDIRRSQGGCKQIGNTLFPRLFPGLTAFGAGSTIGPNDYWTVSSTGANVNSHNLYSGTTSGPRWGAGAEGAAPATDIDNLGTGHGQQIVTDGAGVITAWQNGTAALAVLAGTRSITYADLFENGAAKNAAGLFCNITDVDVLKLRPDIATYLGAWVGAYGSGYVTYQPGHMSDPQPSLIDTAME